jgi:LPXTG-site transpeptidase (sortase) family protein
VVRNENFKAFNNIEDLKKGDRIEVTGSTRTFVYEVESVRQADAETDAIPLTVEGSKLTLATCDSFGEKSDRFVVTANLVESYPSES